MMRIFPLFVNTAHICPSGENLAETHPLGTSATRSTSKDDDDDKDEEEEQEQEEQEEEEAKAKVTVNGTRVRLSGREVNGVKESVACLL
jgi:hypothetical protein